MNFPKAVWILLGGSVGCLLVTWWMALKYFPDNDPAAVLHYSIDLGIDFVGEGKQIVALPQIGTTLLGFNTILGMILYRADRRAAWLLWVTIPVIQVILLGATWLLWRANL
jgi:hypothetical protein